MRTFFKLSLCVFLFGFSVPVIAQQPFAKTLLWRISGNGLKKPSYLFGTMHLTDKRLFNFTDSVYRAIETSDGLAIEVNPDEMMAYIINKTFDQLGKGKSVKDILGNKDYNKYSAPLAKKFGKPADEITTSDLMKEKNKWMTEYLEKGEMPTFVDGYLYGIAKKQGKWIGGIEDVADQANVLDDLIDKSDISYILADKNVEPGKNQQPAVNDGVETMITAYTSQDINAIENITEASTTTERKDILLIHRNIKMARRIDSLAALRTMFFAIGAAHLPGDSGVIRLLQARGFTVEPVMSNKKIAAASYKFKEVETPWVEVKDEQGSYSVSMPGNPVDLKLFGILKMKFLFDITNFSGFYTMSATGPRVFINNDSTYTAFTDRMFRGQPITSEKKLEKNGVKGREYAVSLNGVSARVQIFLKDRTAFVAMVYALKKETTSSPATEKFFRSFIINPGYTPQIAGNTVFSDSIMGISFSSPVTLVANTNISRQDNNGWKISALNNTDPATGNFIMLSSKEVIAGRYISNDSLVYGGMNQFLQLQYDNIKYSDTVIQGIKAHMAEGINKKEPNLAIKLLNVIRANRNITLLVVADTANLHKPQVGQIFSSFRFLPVANTRWQTGTSVKGGFSAWVPSAFRSNNENGVNEQVAYDTATATSYMVVFDTLYKYTWAKSDSSFWAQRIKEYVGVDTLVSNTLVQNAGLNGREILVKKRGAETTQKRTRMLLNGNIIYKIVVSSSRDFLYDDNTSRFFSSFTPLQLQTNKFITASKAGLLLNDLSSPDSATRMQAYYALGTAPFGENDLPLLQGALFKQYPAISKYAGGIYINQKIASGLEKAANPATVTFLKNAYARYNENDSFRNIILTTLAGIHTKESYDVLVQLMQQGLPATEPLWSFESNLLDSLTLTAGIFKQLMPFVKDTTFAPAITNITKKLLDSNFITLYELQPVGKDFDNAATQMLQNILKQDSTGGIDWHVYTMVRLLGKFNTESSNKVLQAYLQVKDLSLKNETVSILLENGQQVAVAAITELAADPSSRLTLYNNLKDLHKEALFPSKYLTQQYFAEASVYQSAVGADDDDDEPSHIALAFLTKKNAVYNDTSYTFYLYKVTYGAGDDTTTYLGVAGGYKPGGNALDPVKDITGLYWKEEYNAKAVSELLTKYLEYTAKLASGRGENDEEDE